MSPQQKHKSLIHVYPNSLTKNTSGIYYFFNFIHEHTIHKSVIFHCLCFSPML